VGLRPFWAHGDTAIAGRRALPAALALLWLGVAPSAGLALIVDAPGTAVAQPSARAAVATLSLTNRVNLPFEAPAGTAAGFGRERRLSVSLFSGGAGSALAVRPVPGISGLTAANTPEATDALSALLGPRSGRVRQASVYRLSYTGGPVEFSGRIIDVGSRFSLVPSEGNRPSAEDADAIKQAIGGRGMSLSGAWRLAPGLSLTSSHDTLRHDDIMSAENGLTASNASHALALNLGQSTSVKASLTQHQEEWDRWLGRPSKESREERLEMNTKFGANGVSGLRLAMATVRAAESTTASQTSTREAHLNLVPTGRLRLNADYVTQGQGGGTAQTTQTVGAALKLAGGQLGVEQKTTRGQDGLLSSRKLAFAGAIGRGPAPTNVKVDVHESRGERPDAPLDRNRLIHVDRRVAPWLTLAAERGQAATGTVAAPQVSARTKYEAAAHLSAKTDVKAGLVTATCPDGTDRRSRLSYAIELPTGSLPEWAKAISSHQFADAQQYALGRSAEWALGEMPFAGYRIWAARRAGGPDRTNSVGFAHRRIVAGRYHVQVSFEDRPEGTPGEDIGRPLPLRRHTVEIVGRVIAGLSLRCGLGLQNGLNSPEDRLGRLKFGLWGRLPQGDQIEGELWRESGQWDQAAVERTSLMMLYSRRVSDEDRVELKVGYTWGAGTAGDRDRDCRLAFALERPI